MTKELRADADVGRWWSRQVKASKQANEQLQLAPPPRFSCCPRWPSIRHSSLSSVSTARSVLLLWCRLRPRCRASLPSHPHPKPDQQHPTHSRPHSSSLEPSYYPTIDNADALSTPTRAHTRPFSPARPLPTQPIRSSPEYG